MGLVPVTLVSEVDICEWSEVICVEPLVTILYIFDECEWSVVICVEPPVVCRVDECEWYEAL